jgi:threonine dehydrogenase-like Zn-dependent dehydrogenase
VLRLLADGVNTNSLITHRFNIREAKSALELLDTGQEHALKILINAR